MYDYIKGKLIEKTPLKIIIEANNIGYSISIPLNFYNLLPNITSTIICYTFLVVKEDSHTLYGFSTKEERSLFEILLSTSGIGPKTALSIIGHLEFSNFANAVLTSNPSLISKIPGIGKKTAERLIIDLKDKIQNFKLPSKNQETHITDAINALINLGYNHFQAQKAIKKVQEKNKHEKDLGKLISLALKNIK